MTGATSYPDESRASPAWRTRATRVKPTAWVCEQHGLTVSPRISAEGCAGGAIRAGAWMLAGKGDRSESARDPQLFGEGQVSRVANHHRSDHPTNRRACWLHPALGV